MHHHNHNSLQILNSLWFLAQSILSESLSLQLSSTLYTHSRTNSSNNNKNLQPTEYMKKKKKKKLLSKEVKEWIIYLDTHFWSSYWLIQPSTYSRVCIDLVGWWFPPFILLLLRIWYQDIEETGGNQSHKVPCFESPLWWFNFIFLRLGFSHILVWFERYSGNREKLRK